MWAAEFAPATHEERSIRIVFMEQEYIPLAAAGENWNMPLRQAEELCRGGYVPGAVLREGGWLVPSGAPRPRGRRSAFLLMTDLYSVPGSAEKTARKLPPPDAARLRAELAYYRGELHETHQAALALAREDAGFDARMGAGMLLSLAAMYRGDRRLWEDARQHIAAAPCAGEAEEEQKKFWLAAAESALYDTRDFPAWFQRGSLDSLPVDALPSAYFFYVKQLLVFCRQTMMHFQPASPEMNAMRVIPAVAEPLISQAQTNGCLLTEIYLRLLCAVGWHDCGNNALAEYHLDRAVALALPDRLYSPLAEYRKNLHSLMDHCLRRADPEALDRVRALNKQLLRGWTKLHNAVLGRTVSNELTAREHEVASLAAFGLNNQEIAEKLHISIGAVKQFLYRVKGKTGAESRKDLGKYL